MPPLVRENSQSHFRKWRAELRPLRAQSLVYGDMNPEEKGREPLGKVRKGSDVLVLGYAVCLE